MASHHFCLGLVLGLMAACGLAGEGSPAQAAQLANQPAQDPKADAGLPNFDIRVDANGDPTPQVRKALAAHPKTPESVTALQQLRKRVELVVVDDDPYFGTPRFVRSWTQMLTTEPVNLPAATVVEHFIADYSALFEIAPTEVPAARVTRNYTDAHNGVTHLTLQQQIKGVDLFDAGIKTNVTADGRLINVSSTMLPRPEGDFAPKQGGLSDLEAIRAGALSVGVRVTIDPIPAEEPLGPSEKRRWKNSEDFRADQAIVTERVYFPMTRDDIRAAWSVVIPTRGIGNTYELVIDAADGTVLFRMNELCSEVGSVTVAVYTDRGPNRGWPSSCFSDSRSLVTINPSATPASPFGWQDTNGIAGPEFTDTRGNNVDAHLDRDANNTADPGSRPNGGATGTFVFPIDLTRAPTDYSPAAVVQAFYWTNLYHDRLYSFGFTEPAGNFQTNNYGHGGAANDAVQMDCQDGSGTNNANFATPVDGTAGRCQMYLWTSTPQRDGDLDALVLFHELTHGLSNRLTGGPANSSALNNTQSGGMGEGWSDFIGLCLSTTASDDANGTYPVGTYVLGQTCTGAGIRRRPYSTNMTTDPLTFDAYGTTGTTPYGITRSTEVHNTGELWCTALWDCRAGLFDVYGFAANDMIIQLVVDAMKLQPANPSFTDARDAILAADFVDFGGANQRILWTAFARRGLGSTASTASSSATTMTISTSLPPSTENGAAERGDAGDLPATAQTIYGSSAPTRITGTLAANDADMYRITICDFTTFSASTVGGPTGFNTINTQLFLFDLAGNPIVFNDDSGATTQSRITGSLLSGNGDYLLAVSGADRDPVSSTGEIWLDAPTTTQRAPDGPGAGHPITGWTGAGVAGAYSIQLSGVCTAVAPATPVALSAHSALAPETIYGACGNSNLTLGVYVVAGTAPASSGVTVTVDGSSLGLGTVTLSGPGGGNGSFSAARSLGSTAAGYYPLPYHVADAQGRTFDATMVCVFVQQMGNCCLPGGGCAILTCDDCAAQSGTFSAGSVPCDAHPCSSQPETEPNNTIAQATDANHSFSLYSGPLVHVGISGAIGSTTDGDYYNIGALQVGDVLTVSESGTAGLGGTLADPLVQLYRAETGTAVTSDDDSGPGTDSLLWRFTIATSDTYYVRGYRFSSSSTGTYRLGIDLENVGAAPSTGSIFTSEVEPNDSVAAANNASSAWRAVQYVSDNSGVITSGDNDYYRYTLTAGDVVSIRVFSGSTLDAKVSLLNAAGTTLATDDGTSIGPGADAAIEGFVIPTSGNYHVRVFPTSTSTGSYNQVLYLSSTTPPALPCGTADFNCDGDVGTDADIEGFFACLAGTCPASPCTNSADFNGDGDVGTDADIESFFRVLAGGPC